MHAQIQQQKQNKKLWNMFKLDSNNTVLMPFLLTLYVLHNVSIIDFAELRKKSSKHFPSSHSIYHVIFHEWSSE